MIFNNTPMSSSPHLTLGMLQFWIMALHPPYLKKSTNKLMIPYSKIQFLMNLENSNIGWYNNEHTFHTHLPESTHAEQDWKALRPYFGWQSEKVIQDTYKLTSRFGGTIPHHDYLKNHFKSRTPVFNIPRRNEPVATDTIFSDTPAINDGSTIAQFFVGKDTLVCDAYGIKSQKQFINTLYDDIKTRGAMNTITTDGGKYKISNKVADLFRSLFIKQYESEPYHQHQNKAEQHYGVVKRYINTLMNLTGAPAHCWLLCLVYVCSTCP